MKYDILLFAFSRLIVGLEDVDFCSLLLSITLLMGRRSMMEALDFSTLFHFLLAILFQCTEVKYEERL